MLSRRSFLYLAGLSIMALSSSAVPAIGAGQAWTDSGHGDFSYASTIDPIPNLYAKYWYTRISPLDLLPVVVVMHGFGTGTHTISGEALRRMASYGLFVVAVGMRGRDGADGQPDASGREIHDIYDAISHIKSAFAGLIDSNHICISGYSGGGGNALAWACKFPDAAQYIVGHFPISDYADWYSKGAAGGYRADLRKQLGGDPAEVPHAYRARDAVEGIANYTGGHLWLYHDAADDVVPAANSQRVVKAMESAGLTNYTASFTGAGDLPRWTHDMPNGDASIIETESRWLPIVAGKQVAPCTLPLRGRVVVLGYIKTAHFSIWLGTGTEHVAVVEYDVETKDYHIVSLTGPLEVRIDQGEMAAIYAVRYAASISLASGAIVEDEAHRLAIPFVLNN